MDKKCNCKDCLENENDSLTEQNDTYDNELFFVIFIFLLSFGFKSNEKLNRQGLIKEINESDLSNSEKKRIIEILLG